MQSEKFVFVHLQKCGGTHATRILTTHFGALPVSRGNDEIAGSPLLASVVAQATLCTTCKCEAAVFGWEDHQPLWCVKCKLEDSLLVGVPKHMAFTPKDGDTRPIIGIVRSPFALYVSLFAYGATGKGRLAKSIAISHGSAFSERLYKDVLDVNAFREWLPYAVGDVTMGLVTRRFADLYVEGASAALSSCLAMNEVKVGGASKSEASSRCAMVKEVAAGFVRQECLEESLLALLEDTCGVEVLPQIREQVMGMGRTWTSLHLPYKDYYDDASRRLVETADRWVLDRFNYAFDQ